MMIFVENGQIFARLDLFWKIYCHRCLPSTP